jgi:predicted  nucleic acid-binding Zn-ribbon protein
MKYSENNALKADIVLQLQTKNHQIEVLAARINELQQIINDNNRRFSVAAEEARREIESHQIKIHQLRDAIQREAPAESYLRNL